MTITRIDLKLFKKIYNPFKLNIWIKLKSPITKEEIEKAINNDNKTVSPSSTKKMYMNFWDASSRKKHIMRIVWFVKNFDEKYPVDIDFGIPNTEFIFTFNDGNHRLMAAMFLKKKYINAYAAGAISEIKKYKFKKDATKY